MDLRNARKEKGVTQESLARQVGVTQGYISLAEAGTYIPGRTIREAIEARLGRVDWAATRGLLRHRQGLLDGWEHADEQLRQGLMAFRTLNGSQAKAEFIKAARAYIRDIEELEELQ